MPKKGALVAAGVELVIPKQGWRHSARQKENDSGPALDAETRARLKRSSLESLEKDNFLQDAYIDNLVNQDTQQAHEKSKGKKAKKGAAVEPSKVKPFSVLLAEANLEKLAASVPSYLTAAAAPSKLPSRPFCSVCGYDGKYQCIKCGARFCSKACRDIHSDTRCQKKVS